MEVRNLFTARFDLQSRLLLKNSTWMLAANLANASGLFLQAVLLARFLGPATFGVYSVIIAGIDTLREFANLNLETALIRYAGPLKAAGDYDRLAALVKWLLLLAVASGAASMALVGAGVALAGGFLFDRSELWPLILLVGAGRALSLVDGLSMALLRVFDRFAVNSALRILLSAVELGLVAWAASTGDLAMVLAALFASHAASFLLRNGVALWECRSWLGGRAGVPASLISPLRGEIWRFILENSAARALKIIHTKIDIPILAAFAGPAAAGFYSVARKLAGVIHALTDPMAVAIYPQISAMAARGAEVLGFVRNLTMLLAVPVTAIVAAGWVWADPVVEFLFGPEFVSSATPLRILMIGTGISAAFFWLVPLMWSLGKTALLLRVEIGVFGSGVLLAVALCPYFGAAGSAAGMTFSYLLGHAVLLAHLWRARTQGIGTTS
jgi:O-antigen/teichoic acid export membrane protein